MQEIDIEKMPESVLSASIQEIERERVQKFYSVVNPSFNEQLNLLILLLQASEPVNYDFRQYYSKNSFFGQNRGNSKRVCDAQKERFKFGGVLSISQ